MTNNLRNYILTYSRAWYAVMEGPDDDDWGTGSEDVREAMRMLKEQRRGYITVIVGDVCEDVITLDDVRDIEETEGAEI